MSSRRKSSTPCMVRVVYDLPRPLSDPEEPMDVDMPSTVSVDGGAMTEGGPSEPREPASEKHQDPPERPDEPEKAERESFSTTPESQSPPSEPSERNEPTNEEEEEDDDAVIEDDGSVQAKESEGGDCEAEAQRRQQRKYECKYCPFSTQNLDNFKEHVDSSHPNVILNPLYLCAVCNFSTKKFDSLTEHNESRHPGETNFKFKRVKANNQTILEQTIEGVDNSVECDLTNGQGECSDNSPSVAYPCISATVTTPDSIPSIYHQGNGLKSQLDNLLQKQDQITAVNINGTVIIPEPAGIFHGLSHHVTPHLQRPPNFSSVPKIAVPLNTTKYNPSLDSNLTLITSFSRFPYPTHAELSWLTAASKHPEEQIKVWFTTQRLKQGITWSPEEVEEARKKMFNGSIPPAHHTFTAAAGAGGPLSSSSSAKASHQQPVVHTTVEHHHPSHVKTSGTSSNERLNTVAVTVTTTSVPAAAGHHAPQKRPLPTHAAAMFAPESKRPVMAVAPHSGGDPKDKGLMAPPPPPPPLKDHRLPMAPPPVPAETKRPAALPAFSAELKRSSAAVPLMPPPPLSSKGKLLAAAAPLSSSFGSKSRPVVSLPSILFQQSLNRPFLAPPPIIAPPYKNYLIPHHPSSINSKDKNPITHALLAPDMRLPNSPPLVAPQIRRPPIIQSARAPPKAPSSQNPTGFPSPKSKEQQQGGVGHARGDRMHTPLSEANGVSHVEARWSHGQNPHVHNNGFVQLYASEPPRAEQHKSLSVPTQFPLLERMKGKTAEQLKILEENFLRKSFPTHVDVDKLAGATCLSRQEIESWFEERRALRDNLEQALLNSMGTKRMGFGMGNGGGHVEKRHPHQLHQPMQLNGIHKHVKSPPPLPPSPILPIVAPLAPLTVPSSVPSNPTSPCSVPADSRSPALLKDVSAQARWPSPEELSQLEARTGLPRGDLARSFADGRAGLKGSAPPDWTELFHRMNSATSGIAGRGGVNGSAGGHGASVSSPESVSSIIQRCQDGGGAKMSEGDLGRLAAELRPKSLSIQQHQDLHDWLSGRLRPQSAAELKNGMQSGGVGGPREVFGSWLDDGGHLRRVRELALEREKKMVEDASGRLTG